jgi:hypothetical protein
MSQNQRLYIRHALAAAIKLHDEAYDFTEIVRGLNLSLTNCQTTERHQHHESDKPALFDMARSGLGIQMVRSMLSAAECRSNSIECKRLAREALSLPIRMAWSNMARTWMALAAQTDRIEELLRERRTHILSKYHYLS